LHWLGDACFIFTVALLVGFLVAWFLAEPLDHQELSAWLEAHANLLTFLAAFLPALGAALAGIRETGDFDKVAERSRKTAAVLSNLSHAIADAQQSLTLDKTGDMLLAAAQVLTEDLAAWQAVYGHKRLELPA
jgi:sensor histidine kinase regulating citrate/malate metabolism